MVRKFNLRINKKKIAQQNNLDSKFEIIQETFSSYLYLTYNSNDAKNRVAFQNSSDTTKAKNLHNDDDDVIKDDQPDSEFQYAKKTQLDHTSTTR